MSLIKEIKKSESGFTLTEVIIGIMILTVAIVTATNLLVGLIRSNKNNVETLQAYYLAQQGIEAFRNMRDTNWMHNLSWLGDASGNPWGSAFVVGGEYVLELKESPAIYNPGTNVSDISALSAYAPWNVSAYDGGDLSEFANVLSIYESDECDECVLVESKVLWEGGDREVHLREVFSNWKGGAI